jgi:hypothetical protein
VLGDGSLAGLESTARDVIGRVLANPDVQNVGDSIRSGALKVCLFFFIYFPRVHLLAGRGAYAPFVSVFLHAILTTVLTPALRLSRANVD